MYPGNLRSGAGRGNLIWFNLNLGSPGFRFFFEKKKKKKRTAPDFRCRVLDPTTMSQIDSVYAITLLLELLEQSL
jgi:hypothetical protein